MNTASQNGDGLRDFSEEVARLKKQVNQIKTRQLRSKATQERVKGLVQQYFRSLRPELLQLQVDLEEMDRLMERLLSVASRDSLTLSYRGIFRLIEKAIPSIEIKRELSLSEATLPTQNTPAPQHTDIDKKILNTLSGLVPGAALSYQQALTDLKDENKVSYRGTAAELREVLREVLDYLAPDKEVEKGQGFAYEKDSKGNPLPTPTMRQKVRFVLMSRGQSKTAIKAPEGAVGVIEEYVASFARSTYERGSLSTHQLTKRPEAMQLKGYVENVLCELLEIHHQPSK